MTALAKLQATVHRPLKPQTLPLVRRMGRHWRLLEQDEFLVPAQADGVWEQGADGLLDQLSDLAHYGLVLPLAEVQPGALLWWPGRAAPEGELQAPTAMVEETAAPPGPVSRIQWNTAAPVTDRWRFGVSSMARCIAASARLPVVHHELLSVAAAMDALPRGDVLLSLSLMDPTAFAWPWRARCWDAVQRRTLMLRERRRLALGLPARCDEAQLDESIQRHFLRPAVQRQLDAVNPDAQRRLHVLAPDELQRIDASAAPLELPVGRYLSDDPLGENIYVLGGRRIQPGTPLARHLRSTGRDLVTLAHSSQTTALAQRAEIQPEWGAAMLAALQLDYLQTHRTVP